MKTYLVQYAVRRSEYYKVTASSPEEAADIAFFEGELAEGGETFGVDHCDIEEIDD